MLLENFNLDFKDYDFKKLIQLYLKVLAPALEAINN